MSEMAMAAGLPLALGWRTTPLPVVPTMTPMMPVALRLLPATMRTPILLLVRMAGLALLLVVNTRLMIVVRATGRF